MTTTKPKILILGGGLSAAYAWRCCLDNDIIPDVIADRIFVPPGGCIWAHWMPTSVRTKVTFEDIYIVSRGDAQGYAVKLWRYTEVKTSFPVVDIMTQGVNPLKAARALWDHPEVHQALRIMVLTQQDIDDLKPSYDLIVQTFPMGGAEPSYRTPIWVVPYKDATRNIVRYEGNQIEPYARFSSLFKFQSYEFQPVPKEDIDKSLAYHWGSKLGFDTRKGKLWFAPEIPPPEIEEVAVEYDLVGKVLYCGRWASGHRKFLSHDTYARVQQQFITNGWIDGHIEQTIGHSESTGTNMARPEELQREVDGIMSREVEPWKVD